MAFGNIYLVFHRILDLTGAGFLSWPLFYLAVYGAVSY
jgi:hypothetical protein